MNNPIKVIIDNSYCVIKKSESNKCDICKSTCDCFYFMYCGSRQLQINFIRGTGYLVCCQSCLDSMINDFDAFNFKHKLGIL